jgi:hypothetical protein
MKKAVLTLVLAVVLSAAAEACTATNLMPLAQQSEGTTRFENAKQAVISEVATQEGWTNYNAIKVASAALIVENNWAIDGQDHLDTVARAKEFIHTRSGCAVAHPGWWDGSGNHGNTSLGGAHSSTALVRHHLVLHGNEWEGNVDTHGSTIPGWWHEEWDEPVEYHGG